MRWREVTGLWGLVILAISQAGPFAFGRGPAWRRASTPDVTIITSLDDRKALEQANEFSQYVAALRGYFGQPKDKLPPLTLVVFADGADFNRYRPLSKSGRAKEVDGFFIRQESWAVAGVNAARSDETRHVVFHEAVHWFLHGTESWMPPWLDEGMAEVFSTFEADSREVRWGRELRGRTALLSRQTTHSVEKLLLTRREDLFGDDDDRTIMFYAEAWAFVHYLMFGENKMPRDATRQYLASMKSGTDPDQAFAKAFGRTYAEMDRQLARYVTGGRYYLTRTSLAEVAPVQIQAATPDEVDDALGRLALGAGRHALALQHGGAIAKRAPTDPRGHLLLALALKELGRETDALAEFERAAELGSTDFQPYFESAFALYGDGIAGTVVSSDVSRRAADLYEKALERRPGFEAAYANLAGLAGVVDPLTPADRSAIEAGAGRFPDNALIKIGLAQLKWSAGDHPTARKLLGEFLADKAKVGTRSEMFARSVLKHWDADELIDAINAAISAEKFREALELIDRSVGQDIEPSLQRQLADIRRNVRGALVLERFNAALSESRWKDVRQIGDELTGSDAPQPMKNEVKRIFRELEKQHAFDDSTPTAAHGAAP